jgi:hypothetical protein
MLKREQIIQTLWQRLSQVSDVAFTARNPKTEPNVDDLPCIQFFEMDDIVEEVSQRGGYPAYKRLLTVVVDSFVKASEDSEATKLLNAFIGEVKKAVYADGASLGNLCSITESSGSRMLRPPVGENVIGQGILFELRYVENIKDLFP